MKIAVAVTGASGSLYARLLVERLDRSEAVTLVYLIFTSNGRRVAEYETGLQWTAACGKAVVLDNADLFAPIASGAGECDALAVVPASMGTVGRVAAGTAGDLVSRACDVMLKERRPLVLVPRETPFNLIHLRNLTALAEAGATVLPACPSFYSGAVTAEALCNTVVDRILSLLGVPDDGRYRWEGR